jgi:transcriptional regulator with XRE-family HTH domain
MGKKKKASFFCARVRQAREASGVSQEALGKTLGVRQAEISRWERGMFPRDEARIVAIAKALNVSLDWLFGLEN